MNTNTNDLASIAEDNFNGLAKAVSSNIEDKNELPLWVQNIREKLNQTIYGNLEDFANKPFDDPYAAGRVVGTSKKAREVMSQYFEKLGNSKIKVQLPEELEEKLNRIMEKFFESILPEKEVEIFDVIASGQLTVALFHWDSKRAQKFFRGIADGLGTIKDDEGNWFRARENTQILIHMYIFWRIIDRNIKTVSELHEWLLRFFPESVVGREQKRLEKICQRLKLKLSKPGRPKKAGGKRTRRKTPTKRK